MLYLIAAIACSTAIALILKYGEERRQNRYVILAMNYSTATVISLWLVLRKNLFPLLHELSVAGLIDQLHLGRTSSDGFLSPENTALWALFIGLPTGVLYFLGFHYYQRSVKESGVGLAGTFAKMGILVPVILSMIFWRELPSGVQWAGMTLALLAIGLANLSPKGKSILSSIKPALLLLFLTSGISEFTGKLFQRYGMLSMKDLFLFFVFVIALAISIFNIRRKPETNEMLTGLAVGIPNFFASFFLINALSALPAAVVFSTYSAGSIAMICIGGRLLYSEKLRTREYAAIALTMAALLLINLK
jgi:multidrug transporter EmrE-like cation transporter